MANNVVTVDWWIVTVSVPC